MTFGSACVLHCFASSFRKSKRLKTLKRFNGLSESASSVSKARNLFCRAISGLGFANRTRLLISEGSSITGACGRILPTQVFQSPTRDDTCGRTLPTQVPAAVYCLHRSSSFSKGVLTSRVSAESFSVSPSHSLRHPKEQENYPFQYSLTGS